VQNLTSFTKNHPASTPSAITILFYIGHLTQSKWEPHRVLFGHDLAKPFIGPQCSTRTPPIWREYLIEAKGVAIHENPALYLWTFAGLLWYSKGRGCTRHDTVNVERSWTWTRLEDIRSTRRNYMSWSKKPLRTFTDSLSRNWVGNTFIKVSLWYHR